MKVSICKGCEHEQDKRLVSSYKPANYHEVGMAHRYAYCTKAKKRCLEAKDAECEYEPKKIKIGGTP